MVKVKKDLTGQMFGRWKVLCQVEDYINKNGRYSNWLCECQCENHTQRNIIGGNLTSGKTKSCGCLTHETTSQLFVDLTGRKFGRLTVLKRCNDYISPSGQKQTRWICECECGNVIEVTGKHLKSGKTLSCGCYGHENAAKAIKKYNKYEKMQNYYVGYDCNNKPFYFDIEDFEKVKEYRWQIDDRGYVLTSYRENGKYVYIRMHELIMNTKNTKYCVDHIHGNSTRNDNRKCNLRIAENYQNAMNKDYSKRNSSGCVGVQYDKTTNKWDSSITVNKKVIYLGSYTSFEEAVKARKEAEKKYQKEFSYDYSQNIPYERIG